MEKLLNKLNGFGKYQKYILFLIGLISALVGYSTYSSVFTAAIHNLYCTNKANNVLVSNSCEVWSSLKNNATLNDTFNCEFDDQYYGNTIVSEWTLQCDRIYLTTVLQSAFMIGAMVSFLGGWLSDHYGRKTVCIGSIVGLSLAVIIPEIFISKFHLEIMQKFMIYAVGQFLVGFFSNIFLIFKKKTRIVCLKCNLRFGYLSILNSLLYKKREKIWTNW